MEKKCYLEDAINIIGGKWRLKIIWTIYQSEVIRYNELKRNIVGITNMMLTQSLKELESSNIINRKQYNEIPPKVEYSLTKEGLSLIPILKDLEKWGKHQSNNK